MFDCAPTLHAAMGMSGNNKPFFARIGKVKSGKSSKRSMETFNIQTCDGGSHRRKDRLNGGMYITKADVSLTISTMAPREALVVSRKRK